MRVEIVKQKRRYLRGRIIEIVEASPHRRRPKCPLFGVCGGCSLQHIEYEQQITAKRNILVQNLHRLGGFSLEDTTDTARAMDTTDATDTARAGLYELLETVSSPREYGYRRRVRMRISREGRPAFASVPARTPEGSSRPAGSRVEIPSCPVATERLNSIIHDIYTGTRSFPTGSMLLIQETDGEVRWEIEGSKDGEIGFLQVNEGVNRSLVEKILGEAQREGRSGHVDLSSLRVIDLFCGNGNLSLPMAAEGARVAGYDRNEVSIKEAQNKSPGIGPASYKKMDIKKALYGIESGNIRPFGREKPNLILLDPPRGGMGEKEMDKLYRMGANTILYVSCDPATLSRDLKISRQKGYNLEKVILFDMFPQTSHFETLAVLRRIVNLE